MDEGSITQWVRDLEAGDEAAAENLWRRYCQRLAGFARDKLPASARRIVDEEDVALSAFAAFLERMKSGALGRLQDRHDLRRVLLAITLNKARDHQKHHQRQKRGGGKVRGDSAFDYDADSSAAQGFGQIAASDMSPSLAAIASEEFQRLLDRLQDPLLRDIALLRFEGNNTDEIAEKLQRSRRTIERKVTLIREIWSCEL